MTSKLCEICSPPAPGAETGERKGIAPDPITGQGDARSLDIKRDWCIEAAKREGDAEVGAGYHSLPEAVAALSSRQAVLEEAKDSERAILLARVVGFAVGSAAAEEHAGLISEFERLGFVTRRKHYSKVGSWEAYALTDSGFDHLERIASRNLTQRCLRAHIFYLRNATTPPAEGETK